MNVEIKARYRKTRRTEGLLKRLDAAFVAIERQTDTYYDVENGWLKIRERDSGMAELIQYFRKESEGPWESFYEMVHLKNATKVKQALEMEHGICAVVKKLRHVWIWKNVRIHFDEVEGAGEFLEFEAVIGQGVDAVSGRKRIEYLMKVFGISKKELIYQSYGDILGAA